MALTEIFKRKRNYFESIPDIDIRLQPNGFVIYKGPVDKIDDGKILGKALIKAGLKDVKTIEINDDFFIKIINMKGEKDLQR